MLGAIVGDIVGSVYEWDNIKTKDFELFGDDVFFTDDTVQTVALADVILSGEDCAAVMKRYFRHHPDAGYGGGFDAWARSASSLPYNSWGNGAAMRISPVGHAFGDLPTVLQRARQYIAVTHDHPEGIKGAQAVAGAIFLARQGASKADLQAFVTSQFHYDLTRRVDEIRPVYTYDESCQGTVPEALICFLESTGFEDAIRNAISIGGDSDTLACITGSVAEAFYGGVPADIARRAMGCLTPDLRAVCRRFFAAHRPGLAPG